LIGGHTNVRGPFVEHSYYRTQYATNGSNLLIRCVLMTASWRVEIAKQFVCAINKVDLHARTLPQQAIVPRRVEQAPNL
jgi:hypothetical protein